MCVRLDLLAESGRRRLEIGSWFDGVVQVESKVPGAYDTVSAAGISTSMSTRVIRGVALATLRLAKEAYSMELSASTARPLTPSLCPPFWLARGRTAHVSGNAR
jgi:hypothetical protein